VGYYSIRTGFIDLLLQREALVKQNKDLGQENENLKKLGYVEKDSLVSALSRALASRDSPTKKINRVDSVSEYLSSQVRKHSLKEVSDRDLIMALRKAIDDKDRELKGVYASLRKQTELVGAGITPVIEKPESTITIDGTITDESSKKPIGGVRVHISDRFSGRPICDPIADPQGHYSCSIPSTKNLGRVFIKIEHAGYHRVEYNAWSGSDRTIDFELSRKK
jgi:hypothetical protein